jgi:hypothetical protein
MKTLLNAHSGQWPVDSRVLDFIRWLGLDGVRRVVLGEANLQSIARQANRHDDLHWSFAIHERAPDPVGLIDQISGELKVPATFEIGREATLSRVSPEAYAAEVNPIVKASPVPLVVNTTHRLRLEEFRWLQRCVAALNPFTTVSVHTYRSHAHRPDKGWTSLEMMFGCIEGLLNAWANTETGWHSARRSWWPCARHRTEEEIAEFLNTEIALHWAYGAELFTIYQAFTGPTKGSEDHFGLLSPDLKPLRRAEVLREMLR